MDGKKEYDVFQQLKVQTQMNVSSVAFTVVLEAMPCYSI